MSATDPSPTRSPQNQAIVKAAAATAATVLVLVGIICIYLFYKLFMARQRIKNRFRSSFRREAVPVMPHHELRQQGGMLNGRIVDEKGFDVLYMRKGGQQLTSCFSKVWNNPMGEEEKIRHKGVDFDKSFMCDLYQEIPLLQEPGCVASFAKEVKPVHETTRQPPVASERSPAANATIKLPENVPGEAALANQLTRTPLSPLPSSSPPRPPPPPPPIKSIPKPPPTPIQAKVNPPPPVPPPKPGSAVSLSKPPIALRKIASSSSRGEALAEEIANGNGESRIKLKPLYWDKVTANVDHSMVWDEINDGSFRFEDDLMETLFGYVPTSKESTEGNKKSLVSVSSNSASNVQIFILDPRKSQNTAIVLKSLAISRREILDALMEGRGLNADTLEKLTKIAPTQEEAASILQFNGNPTKLADAESFLYYILKAVPSAFIRFNAMLFKSNYDPEILHFKESLQAIELACKELRTRGIFLKLLEAILKAGNRMNAGTPRGNAQGFDLSTLGKLSNVKSIDGKTTLLHFVVQQVARFEGKRYATNPDLMISTGENAGTKEEDRDLDSKMGKEEREKEYIMLGLPVVRCLSTELSNVKKAATIDYDSFINTCYTLTKRVDDIRQLLTQCGNAERGGFFRLMKGFLEECNEELKVVKEEQTRVMELVKSTTEYYQAGSSKDKNTRPLQIFVILKDFLDMVDQACIDITRKLQKANMANGGGWSPPPSPTPGTPVRFHNLNSYFMQEKERNFSSDSEDDF